MRHLLLLVLCCLPVLLPGGGSAGGTGRYRILVSNDDGIRSPRLHALVAELAKIGEVVVVAPESNRSGAGHSMSTWQRPTVVTRHEIEGASSARAVSGTPADAVNFGLFTSGLEKPFDVVVAGVNRGHNVGTVAHVSGTVGCAIEAVLRGVPGVAVSASKQQEDDRIAARFAARFVRKLLEEGAPPGVGFNINVPAGRPEKVVVAPMGGAFFRTRGYRRLAADKLAAAKLPQDTEAYEEVSDEGPDGPASCDTRHYCAGAITVTPFRVLWTDPGMLEKMRGWKLGVR